MNTKPHNKRNRSFVVGIILLLLISAAAFLFHGFTAMNNAADSKDETSGIVYDSNATVGGWEETDTEAIVESLNEKVEQGMINISMNTTPVFSDGSSAGNLMIVNEGINNYPQVVSIVRNDTNEIIYQSGAIPVGSKIERTKLDVDLDAGTYDCTALFYNVDAETGNFLGCAGAVITITVLE